MGNEHVRKENGTCCTAKDPCRLPTENNLLLTDTNVTVIEGDRVDDFSSTAYHGRTVFYESYYLILISKHCLFN